MNSLIIPRNRLLTWLRVSSILSLAILMLLSLRGARISAQQLPAIVGRIEGDDLEVVTATPTGVETDAAPTVVAAGSEITLRSGHALLSLDSGGQISICGPAHFKMLKAAGAVTLALDYGRVHPSLNSQETFTIYTPTIIATPIAISGGRRDLTVGLEQNGAMCMLTARGAMRVEPQFSDQSLLIPQGGTANLVDGQIDSLHADPSACSCEYLRPSAAAPRPPAPRPEISTLRSPEQPVRPKTEDAPPPRATEEPIYTVLMPPLSFDANSPAPPPDPSPETILLVREVRLRPAVVFHGRVNPAPVQAVAETPAAPATQTPAQSQPAPPPQPGLLYRMRNFLRKLTSRGPCVGAGCSS